MGFHEKYISKAESLAGNPDTKIVLTDDIYAICEMIDILAWRMGRVKE